MTASATCRKLPPRAAPDIKVANNNEAYDAVFEKA
jgi:hypothetical protein